MKKNTLLFIALFILCSYTFSQKKDKGVKLDNLLKKTASYLNWQNLDLETDQVIGTSVDRAYKELLTDKKAKKTIIVAVIDGGVDVNHEDFKDKIWINKDEIPNNGIDDDKNGYIDDINGWNFIGNSKGENMTYSHLESTRLVRKYQDKFKDIKSVKNLSPEDAVKYKLYKECLKSYTSEYKNYDLVKKFFLKANEDINGYLNTLSAYTTDEQITGKELIKVEPKNSDEKKAKKGLFKRIKHLIKKNPDQIIKKDMFISLINNGIAPNLDYYLNPQWDARKLIGDNEYDLKETNYGNNKVDGDGYGCGHGTFVSGLIAANRNNNIGINGIAENVKIMALRVVPDGDEYDKDVALAIKYAIDNGAQIINMSFGKYYSDNKHMVDKILKQAKDKNVLLFHAAGNEAINNDVVQSYPTRKIKNNEIFTNWLNVGASAMQLGKNLPASFSNYGEKSVDLFAPGLNIISTYPQNTYDKASGTSFSCPVATGVAALVWSYYPELTAKELKNILLKSVTHYSKRVTKPTENILFKRKVNFSKLSVTGGIINAYKALQEAEKTTN